MKKIFFIALLAIVNSFVSCSNDDAIIPNNPSVSSIQNPKTTLTQKTGDTISNGDIGGQGGNTNNPKP